MLSRFGGYHSTKSHLSFLPRVRAGCVAQSNGGSGAAICDLLSAYYYDLVLGRPHAHAVAAFRMDILRSQHRSALSQLRGQDSVRAARQRPTTHSSEAFAGTYTSPLPGRFTVLASNNGLRSRLGVVDGALEVFDASTDRLRLEIAGSGRVGSFQFDTTNHARSLEIDGITFLRE